MNKAFSLIKLYINSVFGLSAILRDMKNNKRQALKAIGFIILILFSFSGVLSMFTLFNIKMFDMLKPTSQQGIVVLNTVIMASAFTFFVGILTVVATYFLNQEGDIILSLPLKSWNLLLAKFIVSYISELIFSFFIMATGILVYGIKNGEGFLYYIFSIIITFLIPVLPLSLGYFLIIPMMKFGRIFKNKDFVMYFSGFFAILIGIIFQYFSNLMAKPDVEIMQKIISSTGFFDLAAKIYYPAILSTKALVEKGFFIKIFCLITFIIITLGCFVLLLYLMSDMYYETLIENVGERKRFLKVDLKNVIKRKNVLLSLLSREMKLMNREPVYFINGPMIIILLPVILAISFYFQKDTLMTQFKLINLKAFSYYLNLISIAGIIFLGASTSIASTCISREGKSFEFIKSLPINPKLYVLAKLLHSLIFAVLASIIILAFDIFIFKLSLLDLLLIFLVSILILAVIFILEILIELKWPKLIWDNPQKAIKQNINAVVGILGTMGFIFLLGSLVVNFNIRSYKMHFILILIFLSLLVVLYKKIILYATKRFYDIEI